MTSPTHVADGRWARWGVSNMGNVMGAAREAGLASREPDGVYEHLAVGYHAEGYTVAYRVGRRDNVCFDVYAANSGIRPVSAAVIRNDAEEFVKVTHTQTHDRLIDIQQSFIVPKNNTRILIQMKFTNVGKVPLDDVVFKRYVDLDVDTGGSRGWAGFMNHFDKNRYEVFAYNHPHEAPDGHESHIVNLAYMPGDLPLSDTFVCRFGSRPFASRNNPGVERKLPTPRKDCVGVLQWKAGRLLPSETVILNMYYDTWRGSALLKPMTKREASKEAKVAEGLAKKLLPVKKGKKKVTKKKVTKKKVAKRRPK